MTNPEQLEERIEFLQNALDHIAKIARGSRTGTRRLAWIEERAVLAIKGKVPEFRAVDMPRIASENTLAMWHKDARRYRKLRRRDELPCAFEIGDLTNVFGDAMDALVDALPPLPNDQPAKSQTEEA